MQLPEGLKWRLSPNTQGKGYILAIDPEPGYKWDFVLFRPDLPVSQVLNFYATSVRNPKNKEELLNAMRKVYTDSFSESRILKPAVVKAE